MNTNPETLRPIDGYLRYREYLKNVASPITLSHYTPCMDDFMGRFRDKKLLQDFNRWDFEDYCEAKRREGTSEYMINYHITVLTTWWRWMLERGFVLYNPIQKISKFRYSPTRRKKLSQEALNALLAVCYTTKEKLAVLFPLTTGITNTEMITLTWNDVDWENSTIRVLETNSPRVLPLRADVRELLQTWRDKTPGDRIFPFGQEHFKTLFRHICLRANIPPQGLKTLKHTFALGLLRQGVPLTAIKEAIGMSQMSNTKRYFDRLRDAVEVLPSLPKQESPPVS